MEQNQNDSSKAMTSLWPMLMFGAAAVLLLQYFEKKPELTPKPQEVPGQEAPLIPGEQEKPVVETKPADFQFSTGDEKTLDVKGDRYLARLSSKGGRIEKFFILTTDDLRIPASVVAKSDDPVVKEYKALEVTRGNGMDFQPHLYFKHPVTGEYWQIDSPELNQASFEMKGPFTNEKTGQTEVSFHLPLSFKGHKLELIKVYRFLKDEYYFHQTTMIRNLEAGDFDLNGDLLFKVFGDVGPEPTMKASRVMSMYGRFYYYNEGLNHWSTLSHSGGGMSCAITGCGKKDTGPYSVHMEAPGSLEFVGSTSRYFMNFAKFLGPETAPASGRPDGIIMINKDSSTENYSVVYRSFHLEGTKGDLNVGNGNTNRNDIAGAQSRKDVFVVDSQVYTGVRREESYYFQNPEIAQTEFGSKEPEYKARDVIYSSMFLAFFSVIRDWIILLMRFMYTYIGNYGWVIIIIAAGFKIMTWPLNQMQVKSMQRMQALKPEMDILNEKYADDPQEKQKKIMELYKKHQVNPAKGCLPMLIQLPIFIALYSAFSESVELWRSPFIFWMTDLSAPDTIFIIPDLILVKNFHVNILPLAMVATQLVSQMTTTVSSDPQQKMMMYMMPVFMIFFMWNMPAGVTLYWSIQNLITILWQFIPQNTSKPGEAKA